MLPKPWSPSALEDFVNCPRAYHAKSVTKRIPYVQNEDARAGEWAHKQFELRVADGTPLPTELNEHEDFIAGLIAKPGMIYPEQEIAFDQRAKPCGFWAKDVWCRGKLDVQNIDGEACEALVTDYKTGKPHTKFNQLKLYTLHTFAMFPGINTVTAQFYWTQTKTTTHQTYTRGQVGALWGSFVPDLKQYVEAFQTDTWQPRPSGLCKGWCPVTDCEHWSPRRKFK